MSLPQPLVFPPQPPPLHPFTPSSAYHDHKIVKKKREDAEKAMVTNKAQASEAAAAPRKRLAESSFAEAADAFSTVVGPGLGRWRDAALAKSTSSAAGDGAVDDSFLPYVSKDRDTERG